MNETERMTPATALPAPPAHALSTSDLLQRLGASADRGLTTSEVVARRSQYGRNVLSEAPRPSLWGKFARQFASLLVGILLVAACVSGVMGEWPDAIAILAIVLLNGLIGFFQEERAERALALLRNLTAPTCRVTRDGRDQSIPAADLVPGDVVHVEAGDHVSADARIWKAVRLGTQEAALTGESVPVSKDASAVLAPATPLGDRRNMLHAGTTVVRGKGTAIVVATGMSTELGRIAGMLDPEHREPTPLERRLATLGRYLVVVCLILVAVIFATNVARGHDPLEGFLFSVSLAVAAVPEGLPAVVTIALALGVRRMVRRQALIRHLPAVETLGCVTVICSDKTGTLTRNEMTVREVWTMSGSFRVTGDGYASQGAIHRLAIHPASTQPTQHPVARADEEIDLLRAITIGAWCNNASVEQDAKGGWQIHGDPTEAALLVLAGKFGIASKSTQRLHEIPFDSDRKSMSVVVRDGDDGTILFIKGAAEVILNRCSHVQINGRVVPLTNENISAIRSASSEMAQRALRVLALAWKRVDQTELRHVDESDLVFVGLVGMIDPPRAEARHAVQRCRDAGIRPVMITGDHPETALAVARELQLMGEDQSVMTGAELDEASDEDLAARVERVSVFARVSAEHKLRVVRALRSRGHVAAMTGDGVNDAPAVKAADIGIAMGRTGTDVTRSASDMVLLDDNFASIVAAVEEGRGILDNIQKVIHYLLSCNAGELILLLFAAIAGWPAPLLAVQILWINLITDGVPALALGIEPPDRDIMRRRPRRPSDPLISGADARSILWHGLLIAAVAAAGFAWIHGQSGGSLPHARAAAFSIVAFSQLFFAIGCRSRRYTMPEIGWFTNPALFWAIATSILLQVGVVSIPLTRGFLKTETLGGSTWIVVFILSLIPVTVVEASKLAGAAIGKREARQSRGIHTS